MSQKEYNGRVMVVGATSNHIITGLSVAFDTFLDGMQERSIEYLLIDTSVGTSLKRAGVFSFRRMSGVLVILLKVLFNLPRSNIVYVTMGSSLLGFIRDLIIIFMTAVFKRKLIFHLHGGGFHDFYISSSSFLRFVIRNSLCHVDRIIVLGELLKNQFDFISKKKRPDIIIVPNGLPFKTSRKIINKTISKNKPIRLLYLSNMIPSKGYMHVLEACKILKKKKINFVCEFAGEFMSTGASSDSVEPDLAKTIFFKTIMNNNLDSEISYHGVVRGINKKNLFLNTDIFLLPTHYNGEGQPISIIEALYYGLPVISTRFRGIPEQIDDKQNGILLEIPNAKNIVNAIEQIINSPENYEYMSKEAYNSFKLKFTREQYLDRLISAVFNF